MRNDIEAINKKINNNKNNSNNKNNIIINI